MASELEKQFFDTFDIQYEFCSDNCLNPCKFQCDDCEFRTERYPEITDHMLLELIRINSQMKDIKVLKAFTLDCLIKEYERNAERIVSTGACQKVANEIKHQVRRLFEEYKNDR